MLKFVLNILKLITHLVKMILPQVMSKYLVKLFISCFSYLNPSN
jgi:hypothetical protein